MIVPQLLEINIRTLKKWSPVSVNTGIHSKITRDECKDANHYQISCQTNDTFDSHHQDWLNMILLEDALFVCELETIEEERKD